MGRGPVPRFGRITSQRSLRSMQRIGLILFCRLLRAIDARRGTSAIESALVAGLIATVIVTAVTAVGTNLSGNFYGRIAAALT